eukprot:GHRR01037038.1.p2 GENE.GHRR01037038.1~~GHRR01037038.1.p2  ORF type:complete len:183 (+),score=57.78 GHRR01037038.1:443-991(+)
MQPSCWQFHTSDDCVSASGRLDAVLHICLYLPGVRDLLICCTQRHVPVPCEFAPFVLQVAGGNGEQVVSRDVHRLARRFNTPRLLTWYHTGNGFFINTSLLMYSLLVNAWLCLLLAFSSNRSVDGQVLQDALALLGGMQLLQLGSLSVLVYVATVWLEDGLVATLKNVLRQLVSGAYVGRVA